MSDTMTLPTPDRTGRLPEDIIYEVVNGECVELPPMIVPRTPREPDQTEAKK